ncbi:hypothetical protein V5P93_003523 [Actinokineospora auranticolor]|uniref:hypothetical protein n=1 Tax=Actinokineospora auranticolor TaxID=155976 RepID=UPI000CEC9432|nr:hypothetical protein [Actinokineospora auranticolor]
MGILLRIRVAPELSAHVRFFRTDEIEVDVSPEEPRGQSALDAVCRFLRAVGRRLGKPVVLTLENARDRPLIGYDVATDRLVRIAGHSGQ